MAVAASSLHSRPSRPLRPNSLSPLDKAHYAVMHAPLSTDTDPDHIRSVKCTILRIRRWDRLNRKEECS